MKYELLVGIALLIATACAHETATVGEQTDTNTVERRTTARLGSSSQSSTNGEEINNTGESWRTMDEPANTGTSSGSMPLNRHPTDDFNRNDERQKRQR